MVKEENKIHKTLLIGLLSILWLLAVFLGYGYTHKPFSPEELIGGLFILWRTLVAIVIISLSGGIGMSTALRKQEFSPLVLAVLASALGMGLVSISVLIIAATIGINFTLWIFLIIAIIFFRKMILLWWKLFQDSKNLWNATGKVGRIAILATILILVCQYLEALAPPLQFDALTYHLALPKAYLQAGHLIYLQNIIFWGMPQLIELLYALAMYLGGTEAAPVLGWWIGLLALVGLAGFTKDVLKQGNAWIAIVCIMSGSGLTTSLSSGYVEWASILYGLCVLICLWRWHATKDTSALAIAGVMAGMALGTKYTNGVILLGGVFVIVFLQEFKSAKQTLINILWFGGTASVIMLPWLIKNFIATLNPFYPVLIPTEGMDAVLLDFYQFKPVAQDWSRLILLPWQATVWGVDDAIGFSVSIGPLLLGLSPLAFINWRKLEPNQKSIIKAVLMILSMGFLVWAVGSQFRGLLIQTRLYFIIFPAWTVLATAGYASIIQINSHNIRFRKLADAFILMALFFNVFYTIKTTSISNPMPVILNLENRESYITRHLGGYEPAMQAIQTLPDYSKVLMLWETRSLECQPKCDPDEIIGRWYHDWTIYKNSGEVISTWKSQGYTHVLFNRIGADYVRKYDVNAPGIEYWRGLESTISTLTLVKENTGGYELYKLP